MAWNWDIRFPYNILTNANKKTMDPETYREAILGGRNIFYKHITLTLKLENPVEELEFTLKLNKQINKLEIE